MLEDYTEIVSKLTLLIGAGMTVRGAFRKVALDYKAKKDTAIWQCVNEFSIWKVMC